jgi:hypothetical protein
MVWTIQRLSSLRSHSPVGVAQLWIVRPHDTTQIMKTTTKTLIVAITTAIIVVGCATTQSWEYRTRTTQERIGKSVLDQYGKSGWELVQFERIPVVQSDTNHVSTTNLEYEYIFKRPKK